jgi:hypothetical protein
MRQNIIEEVRAEITSAGKLSSIHARKRLEPLADALDTRRGSDARDLARMARQVAATRV